MSVEFWWSPIPWLVAYAVLLAVCAVWLRFSVEIWDAWKTVYCLVAELARPAGGGLTQAQRRAMALCELFPNSEAGLPERGLTGSKCNPLQGKSKGTAWES